ncbi:hypothetical protein pb186bvf_006409 [Paramecium bursaria]
MHSRERAQTTLNIEQNYKDYQIKKLDDLETVNEQEEVVQNPKNKSFSIDEMEKLKFQSLAVQDNDIVNKEDSIFNNILDEETLAKCEKNQKECIICHRSFGKLTFKKRQCKFCGSCVCKDHSRKKRQDPQNKEKFVRVCDICDDKYIRRTVQGTYMERREQLINEYNGLEAQAQDLIRQIKSKEQTLETMQILQMNRTSEVQQQQNNILFKISKTDGQITKFQIEEQQLLQDINRIDEEIGLFQHQIKYKQEQSVLRQQQDKKLQKEIDKLEQEISELQSHPEREKIKFSIDQYD